eukprot:767688-Hanusia_phi.AAC.15
MRLAGLEEVCCSARRRNASDPLRSSPPRCPAIARASPPPGPARSPAADAFAASGPAGSEESASSARRSEPPAPLVPAPSAAPPACAHLCPWPARVSPPPRAASG